MKVKTQHKQNVGSYVLPDLIFITLAKFAFKYQLYFNY